MLGRKDKNNTTIRTNDTSRWKNSVGTGERRKTKMISRQDESIETTQDIRKHRQKILPGEDARRHTNNWMKKKQNNFGAKYGNEVNITDKQNG